MRDLTVIERSIDWILVKKKKKLLFLFLFFFFYTLSMINMVIYECLSVNVIITVIQITVFCLKERQLLIKSITIFD